MAARYEVTIVSHALPSYQTTDDGIGNFLLARGVAVVTSKRVHETRVELRHRDYEARSLTRIGYAIDGAWHWQS